jgi:hypothetical protein
MVISCSKPVKEIPMEKMATIVFKLAVDKKLNKDQDPKTLEDAVIEPIAKAEGFTAADFKYTAELIDKDPQKSEKMSELVGNMMIQEMMKAFGGSELGKTMGGALDSLKAETQKQ